MVFEGQDFYFYKNLPIRWVRIVGLVVSIDDFAGRRVFTIDDSSGYCIEAIATYTVAPKTDPTRAGDSNSLHQGHADPEPSSVEPPVPKSEAASPPYPDIDVGLVVDIKGRLTKFREMLQIKIEKMSHLRSTAQEVALWEKRAKFRREVLVVEWTLQDRDIRRCRKEAEQYEEAAVSKQQRIQAAVERLALRHTTR